MCGHSLRLLNLHSHLSNSHSICISLYLADDGEADRKEADNIWKVNGNDIGSNAAYVSHVLSFPGVDWGEIEGIDFDKDKCKMYVLYRIVDNRFYLIW